eukprot:CAMPEP_0184434104 /NCGR_PEP_ID=MMETSP0738-20130409/426346_1 /TAXON_ID=385413 /ORGANISM="Thalassiosira miniscula, Strain CCMP1093" /LENGTH=61 /DNA_ID=CAMNT_0026800025 /DNA_START=42 /DNA_END=224 /DNA_ORIENTATION=-
MKGVGALVVGRPGDIASRCVGDENIAHVAGTSRDVSSFVWLLAAAMVLFGGGIEEEGDAAA